MSSLCREKNKKTGMPGRVKARLRLFSVIPMHRKLPFRGEHSNVIAWCGPARAPQASLGSAEDAAGCFSLWHEMLMCNSCRLLHRRCRRMWSTAWGKLSQVKYGGGVILPSSPSRYFPVTKAERKRSVSTPGLRWHNIYAL